MAIVVAISKSEHHRYETADEFLIDGAGGLSLIPARGKPDPRTTALGLRPDGPQVTWRIHHQR